MVWRRIGCRPLSEPMWIRFSDAYMRHKGEMSWLLQLWWIFLLASMFQISVPISLGITVTSYCVCNHRQLDYCCNHFFSDLQQRTHQRSTSLAICGWNSPVTNRFPSQRFPSQSNGEMCLCHEDIMLSTLRWRHNDHAGVSNHQPHGCLLNRLFRRKSKKTSKLRVTGLCAGNSPGTGEFPAQMASYAENVSIWWRHHECSQIVGVRVSKYWGTYPNESSLQRSLFSH